MSENSREKIERAWDILVSIMGSAADVNVYDYDELFDNLAKMIVIECEVEHTYDRPHLYGTQFPMTIIKRGAFVFETLQGHDGIPGKAIAIILPDRASMDRDREEARMDIVHDPAQQGILLLSPEA